MSTFDIVTVNWNQPQTTLWMRHVEKHCPEANIIFVSEGDLKKLCWSCPKIGSLLADFKHPNRVIYMDTDTIVMADLEELFDLMPKGRGIGVTRYSTFPKCPRSAEKVFPKKGIRNLVSWYSVT
jgi:alpha-N-acetylglucosamine transferase